MCRCAEVQTHLGALSPFSPPSLSLPYRSGIVLGRKVMMVIVRRTPPAGLVGTWQHLSVLSSARMWKRQLGPMEVGWGSMCTWSMNKHDTTRHDTTRHDTTRHDDTSRTTSMNTYLVIIEPPLHQVYCRVQPVGVTGDGSRTFLRSWNFSNTLERFFLVGRSLTTYREGVREGAEAEAVAGLEAGAGEIRFRVFTR